MFCEILEKREIRILEPW